MEHGQHRVHSDQQALQREMHCVCREPRPGSASVTPIPQTGPRGPNVINVLFGMEIGVTIG